MHKNFQLYFMESHFTILNKIYKIQNTIMTINLEHDIDKYKMLLQKLGQLYYEASLNINVISQ